MIYFFLQIPTVRTPRQLDSLTIQTYILGAVAGFLLLLVAALGASSIKYEGGAHPKDPGKRRSWFWILAITTPILIFLYNMFIVSRTISINLQTRFMSSNVISAGISLLVFIIIGFIISKLFSTGKLGNWFPSKAN